MVGMVFRDVQVISLSLLGSGAEILHPENIALKLDGRVSPLDIGVLAYSIREKQKWKSTYKVGKDSLVLSRRILVLSIIDSHYISGARSSTIQTDFKNLEYVMDWCDANGRSDAFCNPEAARISYFEFTDHLNRTLLQSQDLRPLTCQQRQTSFRRAIELVFPKDKEYVVAGIPPIKAVRFGMEPPETSEIKRYISIVSFIASRFSEFVMKGESFPFKMSAPDFETYVFPGGRKIVTPYSGLESGCSAYNYKEGRLLTLDEYKAAYPFKRVADAREALASAQEIISSANDYLRHPVRLRFASLAMQAYACLLNMVVAANSGEFVQFLYDDAAKVEKSNLKNELSAIKFRAKGKKTYYSIGRGPGLSLLRNYLKLREWVLNGRECDYLFFYILDRNGLPSNDLRPFAVNFSTKFHMRMRGVFIPRDRNNIPPALVRKYKSLVLHELKFSPALISGVLNHTERMNLAGYSGTTSDRQNAEFEVYWKAVRGAADKVRGKSSSESVPISVGHCADIHSPMSDIAIVPIEPDCTSQYGCLFCANYTCHADDVDVHKLLSFKYVVDALREGAPDVAHAEKLLKDVSLRISVILAEISKRSTELDGLVSQINKRVYELGVLTPFWERRLQRYEKVGVYL